MGQKVHPIGMRLGIVRDHDSVWFATGKKYRDQLLMDLKLRDFIMKKLSGASVSRVVIERPPQNLVLTIYSARPGLVLGSKGQAIDELRDDLEKMTNLVVDLKVVGIDHPDLDAKLVADNIARQLENRVAFRRVLKRAMQHSMRSGAEGVRVQVAGRLGGTDIARTEWYREGRVPLHTLRADVDYAIAEAQTTYGVIGVKVWIFRGEILDKPVKSAILDDIEEGVTVDQEGGEIESAADGDTDASSQEQQAAEESSEPEAAVEAAAESSDEDTDASAQEQPVAEESVEPEAAVEEAAESSDEDTDASTQEQPVAEESVEPEAAVEEETESSDEDSTAEKNKEVD